MKTAIKLSIEKPCKENYNHFAPTSKGGFCNSCKKEVIDFTKMQAEEITNYFKTHTKQNTCGRFNNSQLKTYILKPTRNKWWLPVSNFGLACLAFFTISTTQAQEPKTNSNTIIPSKNSQKPFVVKGTILDETGLPLPSATILLEGTSIGTTTDFDGNFEFPKKLKQGDVLQISYVGYQPKKIKLTENNSLNEISLQVAMSDFDVVIMGTAVTKKVYTSKGN